MSGGAEERYMFDGFPEQYMYVMMLWLGKNWSIEKPKLFCGSRSRDFPFLIPLRGHGVLKSGVFCA